MKVLITIDEETKDILDFLVKNKGMNQSGAVRVALKEYFESDQRSAIARNQGQGNFQRPGFDPYETPYIDAQP